MKKIMDYMERGIRAVVTCILLAFILLVAAQVFFRYVLSSPLPWTEQAARYLFVWSIMLEMPVLFRRNANIAFDLVQKRLPVKAKKAIDIIGSLLIGAFAAIYFQAGLDLCIRSGAKLAVGLEIPIVLVYAAQPVGAALLFIVVVERIIDEVHQLISKEEVA